MTGNGSGPGSGDAGDGAINDAVVASLGLGWHIGELFGRVPVPRGPEPPGDRDSLPGLSDLGSYRRQLLGLDQIDFTLVLLKGKGSWPDATLVAPPDTRAARSALEQTQHSGDGPQGRRVAYRNALWDLHRSLLVTLQAANPAWGKAYGLGRALEETVQPRDDEELRRLFRAGRIAHLIGVLNDLSSVLPPHAGKSVASSLGWWATEVSAGLTGAGPQPTTTRGIAGQGRRAGRSADPIVAVTAASAPRLRVAVDSSIGPRLVRSALRRRPGIPAEDAQPLSLDALRRALPRQGQLWRAVLTGEEQAPDLLVPDDYLQAAEALAARTGRLLVTATPAAWLTVLLLALAVLAVIVVLGLVVEGSGTARTATGFGALAAALLAGWGALRARVAGALKYLETPLWGAELDRAIADALTLPPVGAPPRDRWTTLIEEGAYQAAVALRHANSGDGR